jgi:hypothetical protein
MVDEGVEYADLSGYSDWSGYDGYAYRARTDLAEARYEGACDDVATAFGVSKVDDWVDLYTWSYGYGPMTDAWFTEMFEAGVDVDALGDTIGTTYLEWDASGSMLLNLWGYFQVYPFTEGTHFDIDDGPTEGVSDSATPFDGYYENGTVYLLTFGA